MTDQQPDLEQRLRELAEKARAPKPKKRYWPYLAMGAIGIAAAIAVVYELGNNFHTSRAPNNNQQYQSAKRDLKPIGSPEKSIHVDNIVDPNLADYQGNRLGDQAQIVQADKSEQKAIPRLALEPSYKDTSEKPAEVEVLAVGLFTKYETSLSKNDADGLIKADKELENILINYSTNIYGSSPSLKPRFEEYQAKVLTQLRELAKKRKEEYAAQIESFRLKLGEKSLTQEQIGVLVQQNMDVQQRIRADPLLTERYSR